MKRLFSVVALVLALAACATNSAQREVDRLALYTAHAGPPIPSFRYFGSLYGWTPLGDAAIAVWPRPNQAYLLSFNGRCPDLDFASVINVSSQSGTVYSKFDKVVVVNRNAMRIPCNIREIRPLDVKAIQQAQRDIRANAQVSERP